jgi:hypothetical protein
MAITKSTNPENVDKDVGREEEPLYTVGGDVNYYSHYGSQCRGSPKNKQ